MFISISNTIHKYLAYEDMHACMHQSEQHPGFPDDELEVSKKVLAPLRLLLGRAVVLGEHSGMAEALSSRELSIW